MRQNAVMFQAAGLNFEGVVAEPDDAPRPVPGILICHPGPLNGGNMDNNVVTAVSAALAQQGFATIRFNFRGVGNSQGEHSHGELEHEEALAALDFLKAWPGVDGETLGMVGYSFGNRVILGSGDLQKEPSAFAFISPALEALKSTCLKTDTRPKFVITGELDRLAPSSEFHPTLDSFAHPFHCQVIAGADHFWVGKEEGLSQRVVSFFCENLKQP